MVLQVAAERLKLADHAQRLSAAELTARAGELELTSEWMEGQGSADDGYEKIRKPRSDPDDFEATFELGSQELKAFIETNKSS